MSLFPAGNSPYLFYRVKIGRIRRQWDYGGCTSDIQILFIIIDKVLAFLMLGGIVHDNIQAFAFRVFIG